MNGAGAPASCPHCGQPHPEDVLVCPTAGKVMPLEGRLLDGKFRFTRMLGAGGMGAVWKAQNIRVKKAVAIKLMHAEFAGNPGIMDRFKTEATAAGTIGNAHICDIYDFGNSVLGPYIVLEMLHGRSLGELVQQQGRVDPGLAVLIIRQALIGLGAAHAVGIVHRDLKPENIFLHEPTPGHLLVKLMDFGISKFTQGAGEGRTSAGVLMGTPEYMSPEQTEGAAGVDHRTDIWAMGAILYKALTGAEPFSGSTMAAVLVAVSTKNPTPIAQLAPHVPPGLIEVIDRCLSKDANQRYASAFDLSNALAPFENLGAPLPAMAPNGTMAPMTAAPMTASPPSGPPAATMITGGPPMSGPPAATMITGGPPMPGHAPATMITGGPPVAPTGQPTWSGEIGRPAGADDSWSLGGGPVSATTPPTLSGSNAGGGGKGLLFGLLALVLIGGGAGAFFVLGKKGPDAGTNGPTVGPTADTKTDTPPDSKVDTKVDTPPDTKGVTPDAKVDTPPDTKVDTPPDTKTDPPPDTKTDPPPENKPETHKPTTKPKELVNELDFPSTRLAGKMDWEKAKQYCDDLKVGGLKSWRLPKSSELQKFKGNVKLASRKYWTNESSAGRVKVYDFAKGATEEAAPNLGVAYPLCVAYK